MRTKTNIFPTNLQPEYAENALQFLSAVYNKRYTSEKIASRFKQSGRSMIEMLGVLAIIGVLTVGSITAYSRAMRRHLLNKQREQISYILSAIETHRDMLDISPNSTLPNYLKTIFETLGWIPEEMIRKNDNAFIYDVFGNLVRLELHRNDNGYGDLSIELYHNHPREQCINLYQMIQQYHAFAWQTGIGKYYNDGSSRNQNNLFYGDKDCIGSRKCIRDLTPAKISELCSVCDEAEAKQCRLSILWK